MIIALFWFIFALLSGAEELGGGITGIILNSPNVLPWLALLIFVYIACKWELIGGSLIAILGIFTIFFFNVAKHTFALYGISIPLIGLGGLLMVSWYFSKV